MFAIVCYFTLFVIDSEITNVYKGGEFESRRVPIFVYKKKTKQNKKQQINKQNKQTGNITEIKKEK